MTDVNEEELGSGLTDINTVTEYSTDKRFSKKPKLIAEGKYKKVFLGYDHDKGREVAWSTINLSSFSPSNRDRIIEDLQVFSRIESPSFLKVIKSWHNNHRMELIIITELVTCSLKHFVRNKLKVTRVKVIKVWIKELVKGLQLCHSMNVVHGSLKTENLFISASDSSIRIGLFNSLDKSRSANKAHDLKSLAFIVTELCIKQDLNYANLFNKSLPQKVEMIVNERVKDFIKFCFGAQSAEAVFEHSFLTTEDPSDSLPIQLKEIEDFYEVFIETLPCAYKCVVVVTKNDKVLCKTEIDHQEEVSESVAEKIAHEQQLPGKVFFDILNQIENFFNTQNSRPAIDHKTSFQDITPILVQTYNDPSFHDLTPISLSSNHCSFTSEPRVPKNLSFNLEVKDISHCKKFKIDLEYNPEIDSPRVIAQQLISKFSIDQSELPTITKLITDKLGWSESETYSNYSNQDLLDFAEELPPLKPCLNSTNEFSVASEPSSLRSSYEPPNESHKMKEEPENRIICAKSLRNDPKDVKQIQEALAVALGVRISNDGVFCVLTEKFVKKFQEENGLTPTGEVCERLWDSIMVKAKIYRNG